MTTTNTDELTYIASVAETETEVADTQSLPCAVRALATHLGLAFEALHTVQDSASLWGVYDTSAELVGHVYLVEGVRKTPLDFSI